NPPDIHATGQDLSDLLASILRIDVDHTEGDKAYRVPEDNPFTEQDGVRPEIWAYGFRNPWKMSFDPDGNLWVGDVGWELWEMIFRVDRGGNYGWSIVEGPQPVRTEYQRGPTPIIPGTVAHSHIESRSITGGFVYTGNALPKLRGSYIYGDYVTGKIWSLPFNPRTKAVGKPVELVDSPLQIITFGEETDGELFVVDYNGGLYRLADNSDRQPNRDFPTKLSETGLFQSDKDDELAEGVIPYGINAEPWEDGATAMRALAIPGAPTLDLYEKSNAQIGYLKGHWKYPTDTVFVKTLSLDMGNNNETTRRIETQLLHYDEDTWRAYTYEWNEEQTDATLVPSEGKNRTFKIKDPNAPGGERIQSWRFASRTECIVCHVTRTGSVLGFHVPQLDIETFGTNQLEMLTGVGLFRDPHKELKKLNIKPESAYPDPYDKTASIESRARTYLQVNCAHCHLRGGGGTAPFELLSRLPLEKTGALAARPTQGTFDIFGAEVISPEDPYRSVLYHRLATLGKGHMPHIGAEQIDERGLKLISDWITSLPHEAKPDESDRIRQRLRKADEKAWASLQSGQNVAANLDHLLSSTSGALLLMEVLDSLDQPARKLVLKRAAETEPPIRGLFERFLPPEARSQRLGTSVKPEEILALQGDAMRGRELFLKASGVQCRNCHQVGDQGKELGPKLDGIAKKLSPEQILESILEPSKKIDPKFVSYLMETSEGQVHSGLLVKRDAKAVVLKDSGGKEITVPTDQVEQLVPQQKSIMPELLLRDLTAEQVADLLAFLNRLK
ncbi:MAG: PQQ-dependent sugar dehydrogenase, partial [Planctomycetaceae bacterium]|nr:PQQ-dependent sugar dehydrogenase [Planctomycetaceae bacterium]